MRFSGLFLLAAASAALPHEAQRDVSISPRSPETASSDSSSPMHMEFHYTSEWIEVGDLWLFDAIRNAAYNASDDAGIEADHSSDVNGAEVRCIQEGEAAPSDLNVRVQLSGEWGQINDIDGWEVRNTLIDTLWELVDKTAEQYDTLWSKCKGPKECINLCAFCNVGNACDMTGTLCFGSDSMEFTDSTYPKCTCSAVKSSDLFGPCFESKPLMKLPSRMALKIYNGDGSLRADSIDLTISSQSNVAAAGSATTCGKMGAVAEVGLSFIPIFGTYMEKAVKIICRESVGL